MFTHHPCMHVSLFTCMCWYKHDDHAFWQYVWFSTLQFPSYGILTYICIRIRKCVYVSVQGHEDTCIAFSTWKTHLYVCNKTYFGILFRTSMMDKYVCACMSVYTHIRTQIHTHIYPENFSFQFLNMLRHIHFPLQTIEIWAREALVTLYTCV